MISQVLKDNNENNSELQIKSVMYLEKIFDLSEIKNLEIKNYYFIGTRGKFNGIENYSLFFNFNYYKCFFEFYLSYDQLEYYILRNNKILKRCNLEDYTENVDEMSETYMNYLKRDMKKLNLPFGNR